MPGRLRRHDRAQEQADVPQQHFAFTVSEADVDVAAAELRRRGIAIEGPMVHEWIPAKSLYFATPTATTSELCAHRCRADDRDGPADVHVVHPGIAVSGRVMFTPDLLPLGHHALHRPRRLRRAHARRDPFRPFWVMISGLVELAGAALVLTNRYPRLGAWMIFVFLVPVTITVHGAAMATATDETMFRIQQSFFLKGITMAGAALLITQLGVRRPAGD
jgi:hypothetical protein